YFTHYYSSYLVLDKQVFYSTYITKAIRSNFSKTVSLYIMLVVCTLGSNAAYYDGYGEWAQECEADVGIGFFNTARELFSRLERVDWSCVQFLLLMEYIMSHTKIRLIYLLILSGQILAEFDLPYSGLGNLANFVPLPTVSDAPTSSRLTLDQLFFLALITIRKLLNRIMLCLYMLDDETQSASLPPADTLSMFLSASHSIINELDRQLEEWRACLPHEIRFPQHSSCRLRGFLITRYCTAKPTIYRLFIFRALHAPWPLLLSDSDKAGARTAVSAAFVHCLHSGLLHEPLHMLFHPINT
ncbi:hypothetical protein C7974DRAFT_322245, partial [Boeremia exigua]|uniref:uncharacterized protein n=1 Tax=Boeremia exigua TaxID=749465 RepID=UPI001E8E6542